MNSADGQLHAIVLGVDPWGLIREFGLVDHLDVCRKGIDDRGRD